MEIINSLDQLNIGQKTAVALGNFDGIHIGHREIFRAALEAAKEQDLKSLCFTFSNHPFNFILRREDSDPDAVKLICTEDEKIELIENMGFDMLVNVPFDEHIMTMHAHEFFQDIVKTRLNAGYVSVGFNYTYGARATGRPDTLRRECEEAGIGVGIHEAVVVDGEVVSSTLIREMIAKTARQTVFFQRNRQTRQKTRKPDGDPYHQYPCTGQTDAASERSVLQPHPYKWRFIQQRVQYRIQSYGK